MNKGDEAATRADARLLIDKPRAFLFQLGERTVNIGYRNCNVMNSGTAFGEKTSHGRIWRRWLQQFNFGLPDRERGHSNTLLRHLFSISDLQSQCIAPYCRSVSELSRCDSYMVNLHSPIISSTAE